ncbi:MAG: dUTP diphosphatase [Aliarcobacter sp.]|nr:dUTP diphosphatase [Aliarcobacter sp.]
MNKNIFEIMVEMQHQFNKQVAEDYLDKNFNWNSAIIVESGELLESAGFKWWKKQVPDMENVKVEAIDLLHFVISESIQKAYNVGETGGFGLECVANEFEYRFNSQFVLTGNETLIKMIDLLNFDDINRFNILKMIFIQLNMSNKDIYIAYITKNCLNKFRQDFGYKDGSYIKDWNGKEDNVVAFELANKIGATENLFKELYNDLKKIYVCNIAFSKDKEIPLNDIDYKKALDTEV